MDDPLTGGKVCRECTKFNVRCSFAASSPSGSNTRPLLQGSQLPLPEMSVLLDVVEKYIEYVHGQPHCLFHAPSLMESVKHKTAYRTILYGIIGLAAQFSSLFKEQSKYSQVMYMNESKRALRNEADHVCLENVQAAVLVTNICFAQNKPAQEIMYCGIGIRMGQILKLHKQCESDSPLLRETKLRVWWSLFMADIWTSGNIDVPGLISGQATASISYSLPSPEILFIKFNMVTPSFHVDEYHYAALWPEMIKLVRIYEHIQGLNRELVSNGYSSYDEVILKVRNLQKELDTWRESLLPCLVFNVENLQRFIQLGLGRMFVSTHLGYHHYACILYFQFLDESQPLTSIRKEYAELCVHHAQSQAKMIDLSLNEYNCLPLFNTVGHIIVVCSSVLLHKLHFGPQEEVRPTKELLESNFAALNILKKYWRNVELMIEMLQTFQSVCKLFSYNAFQMDNWMLNFLLRYSLSAKNKGRDDVDALQRILNTDELVEQSAGFRLGDDLIASLIQETISE